MRLFAPLFAPDIAKDPDVWVAAAKKAGHRAAYCPISPGTPADLVQRFSSAALAADIRIAEVGAWVNNPIHPDLNKATIAIERCQAALALADEIGAVCCVNVSGSRHPDQWAGPHRDNLSQNTFDAIVESVRRIVDGVRPSRAVYAIETMPWAFPDSPESYLRLIAAIDRKSVGVHLDVVNLINCPERLFHNSKFIEHCFDLLGSRIVTCHAKDIAIEDHLTVHLNEKRPGLGSLDYHTFFRCAAKLHPDIPVGIEHLPNEEEYLAAEAYLRGIGAEVGATL